MIGEIGDKKRPLANYAINASIIGKISRRKIKDWFYIPLS